jgi:hypothetical protein
MKLSITKLNSNTNLAEYYEEKCSAISASNSDKYIAFYLHYNYWIPEAVLFYIFLHTCITL